VSRIFVPVNSLLLGAPGASRRAGRVTSDKFCHFSVTLPVCQTVPRFLELWNQRLADLLLDVLLGKVEFH
jgi:hypothetical protein